ncbi:MAG TPA: OB-fold domain-containing protein [Solirubrobacteraceae bacterium]
MSDFSLADVPAEARAHWEALRERGELVFQRCASCGVARLPPREACPTCLSADATWEVASGRGAVVSWVVYHRAYDPAFAARVPYVVALVALEEGPRMLTNVRGPQEGLAVGASVQLAVEREGELALARFAL